jgi:hypothetical protein
MKTEKTMFGNKELITKGIKTSCKHKEDLYLNCRSSNNQLIKIHYRNFLSFSFLFPANAPGQK